MVKWFGQAIPASLLVFLCLLPDVILSLSAPHHSPASRSRRDALTTGIVGHALAVLGIRPSLARAEGRPTFVLRLDSPQDKAGLALYDIAIGTPPRTVVAIQKIVATTKKNRILQPGLVLKGYSNAKAVVDRLQQGPYPIELEFYNLDSSNGELGEALTAQDALQVAQKQSSEPTAATSDGTPGTAFVKRVIKSPDKCKIRARRDDVLEIIYSAHIGSLDGVIYDDSSWRGTGFPYQMVLGSGDMIPGVDQGLYNMCQGEVRQLTIPPALAYGAKGNKMFRIPPNAPLVWEVELVSVSTMREVDEEED